MVAIRKSATQSHRSPSRRLSTEPFLYVRSKHRLPPIKTKLVKSRSFVVTALSAAHGLFSAAYLPAGQVSTSSACVERSRHCIPSGGRSSCSLLVCDRPPRFRVLTSTEYVRVVKAYRCAYPSADERGRMRNVVHRRSANLM